MWENTLSTQQNKNFVELEGGKNGVNWPIRPFGAVSGLLWLSSSFDLMMLQFSRFTDDYECPN